jgi:porphobilinogen deaminase
MDGQQIYRDDIRGPCSEAADLGRELARRLLDAGAAALLGSPRD